MFSSKFNTADRIRSLRYCEDTLTLKNHFQIQYKDSELLLDNKVNFSKDFAVNIKIIITVNDVNIDIDMR